MPQPLAPPQMGGTGLSGLALADDLDGWPAPWGAGQESTPDERIFYVANPITNSIQLIVATRAGERYTYRKGDDLLKSGDPSFRPVALQFGPDGCLYVVDWYNKVISHNEVPRTHPDRDRIRGRIWRIRHASQPVREPVAIAAVATENLPRHLGVANARLADLAWQEIIDRDARTAALALKMCVGHQQGLRRLGWLSHWQKGACKFKGTLEIRKNAAQQHLVRVGPHDRAQTDRPPCHCANRALGPRPRLQVLQLAPPLRWRPKSAAIAPR
jgi:hypothetical protein